MEKQVRRAPRLDLDGVLLLDKPKDITSNDALIRAKRLFNAKKAGHTGTLDPFATGLLPLCFGEATKFSQDLLDADKTYDTVVKLGEVTDTGDTEGLVLRTAKVPSLTLSDIETVLDRFRGAIKQVPPMYSALKRDGKPLYEYAREGITVERAARDVIIHELRLVDWQMPFMTLSVTCSKGTYIRVLGADIGEAIGCGAHLVALRRTRVGELSLSDAIELESLQNASGDGASLASQFLKPVDWLLAQSPAVTLDEALAKRYRHGQRLSPVKEGIDVPQGAGRYRIYGPEGVFLGTAKLRDDGILAPERLVALREH